MGNRKKETSYGRIKETTIGGFLMPRSYRHISQYKNVTTELSEYINFYNNYRIQTKTKLTPLEKRNQFVA